jgi:hypothetical protein
MHASLEPVEKESLINVAAYPGRGTRTAVQ